MSDCLAVNVTGLYALDARLQGSNADAPPVLGGSGHGIQSYTTEMSQFEIDVALASRFWGAARVAPDRRGSHGGGSRSGEAGGRGPRPAARRRSAGARPPLRTGASA